LESARNEGGQAITIGIVNPQAEAQAVELRIDGVNLCLHGDRVADFG
jgi:hypothetical protein